MDLLKQYNEIEKRLEFINFNKIWTNFHVFEYAIYNSLEVCYLGRIIPKTDEFLANTSIKYQGKDIAIFMVDEDEDMDILTSKIVHEMFHAFQIENNELRFPNEKEAICKYQYTCNNLSIKNKENILLIELLKKFDKKKWDMLLLYKAIRNKESNYELDYEMHVEQIEGTANFVELEVLKILDEKKYLSRLSRMVNVISNPQNLFPIRVGLYDSGALLIKIMMDNNIFFNKSFTNKTFCEELIKDVTYHSLIVVDDKIGSLIDEYYNSIRNLITRITKDSPIIVGRFELLGLNIFDAKYYDNYIYTTYFLMYKDGNDNKILNGDFLIEINNDEIIKIYEDKGNV